jgi:hypothetical protein
MMAKELGKEELINAYRERREEGGCCFVCGKVDS